MSIRKAVKFLVDCIAALKTICRVKLSNKSILIVLSYHRVLKPDDTRRNIEIPGMSATPSQLSMHLKLLKKLEAPTRNLKSFNIPALRFIVLRK